MELGNSTTEDCYGRDQFHPKLTLPVSTKGVLVVQTLMCQWLLNKIKYYCLLLKLCL